MKNSFIEFIKFGIVGISNTVLSYGVEMFMYYVALININIDYKFKVIIASLIALVISVINSYCWNNKYVFKTNNKGLKAHLISYFKSLISYSFTGLILSPMLKIIVGEKLGFEYWLVSIVVLIISVPINFLINKYWAFKK